MLAQEPELDDQQTQDTGQGNSAHDPPSESKSPSSAPCARPVPESDFDMIDFMHQSAAYDMQQVLQQAEDLPPILRLLMILRIPMVLILLRLLMFAAFRINMWTQAKERRFLTHRLCSCILDDEPQGYSALDWEKTKLHVTCMNFMLSLMPPMDFLLCQLTEAVLVCMGSSSQLRYTDFISQKPLDYLWFLFCLCYLQNRALLATLRKIHATGGKGHIALFNTLAIGHFLSSVCKETIEGGKSSRLCLHTTTRDFARGL